MRAIKDILTTTKDNEKLFLYPITTDNAVKDADGIALDERLDVINSTLSYSVFAKDVTEMTEPAPLNADLLNGKSAKIIADECNEYTDDVIANLINGAPETLDTLGEIAEMMEDNKEAVDLLQNAIVKKADKTDVDTINTKMNRLKIERVHYTPENTGYSTLLEFINSLLHGNAPVHGVFAVAGFPDLPGGITNWGFDIEMISPGGTTVKATKQLTYFNDFYVRVINAKNQWNNDWHKMADETVITKNISNPNLLINPDFKINQRGKTSYTTNKNDNGGAYFPDRWRCGRDYNDADLQYTIDDDGLHATFLTEYTSYGFIKYYMESSQVINLRGKTVTFSLKTELTETTDYIRYVIFDYNGSSKVHTFNTNESGVHSCTVTIPSNVSNLTIVVAFSSSTANNTIVFNWAKLELGEFATPFTPPNPAEELLKCQRYYQRVSGNGQSVTICSDSRVFTNIKFITEMRIAPTVKRITDDVQIFYQTSNRVVHYSSNLTFGYGGLNTKGIKFLHLFSDTDGPTIHNTGYVGYIDDSKDLIECDAEIY